LFFPSKLFQGAAKAFQRWFNTLPYDRPKTIFSPSHTALFKPPKQKGAYPPSGNPLINLFDRGGVEKVITFYQHISNVKQCLGHFSLFDA
jgi:hypothetical protein